jgi:hypothetical protein
MRLYATALFSRALVFSGAGSLGCDELPQLSLVRASKKNTQRAREVPYEGVTKRVSDVAGCWGGSVEEPQSSHGVDACETRPEKMQIYNRLLR